MKNHFLLLWLFLLFSGCYSQYYLNEYADIINEQPLLTDIPIKPMGKKVKIFFPGEKLPEEPYVKVDILEVSGSGRVKNLIEDLQFKGQLRGVDALVIMGNETFEETYGDYVTTVQKISALGIKYVKNIDYLEKCIRQANIIALDKKKNKYDTVAVIKTDWRGQLTELEKGDPKYWDFLYNFSLQHLVYEKNANWKFQIISSDGIQNIKRVRSVINPSTNQAVDAEIVSIKKLGKRILSLDVKNKMRRDFSAKITCSYDEEEFLTSKDIISKAKGNYRQKFTYREDGEILRIDVFKIEKEVEQFYFKAIFETYQQSDLEKLLEADQKI